MRNFLLLALFLSVLTFGGFSYLSFMAKHSHGIQEAAEHFMVKQGENAFELSARLKDSGLITSRYAFLWHLAREGKSNRLVAGTYLISGKLSPAEIAFMVTEGNIVSRDVRVTFPEGWDMRQMAERLTAQGLPGAAFLALAEGPSSRWQQQFDFLAGLPGNTSLEGFLFPDTYFFDRETSAELIIEKMLTNFDQKVDPALRSAARERHPSLYAALTLASIVENEVRSEEDRALVSDIFLRRLAIGQALESDATVKYILGIDKIQHTFEETRVASPYNTYINKGLPPGPIGNPGLVSIRAAIFPRANAYFYFLSDANTGETVFSVTYEEHLRNKSLHGL